MHLVKRFQCKAITISGGWKEKLLAHDFASRQKGKYALLLTLVQATAVGRASSSRRKSSPRSSGIDSGARSGSTCRSAHWTMAAGAR